MSATQRFTTKINFTTPTTNKITSTCITNHTTFTTSSTSRLDYATVLKRITTYVSTPTTFMTTNGVVSDNTLCRNIFLREAGNTKPPRPYTTKESRNIRRQNNRHEQSPRHELRRSYETETHTSPSFTLRKQ